MVRLILPHAKLIKTSFVDNSLFWEDYKINSQMLASFKIVLHICISNEVFTVTHRTTTRRVPGLTWPLDPPSPMNFPSKS